MHAEPAIEPAPAAASLMLDDPVEQAAFTSWSQGDGGARIAQSHLQLSGLYCTACAGLIENALQAEPGVLSASVQYGTQRASVRWQPGLTRPSRLVAAIVRAGYGAAPDVAEPSRALRQREQRSALWRLFVAVFCMMQVMMYAAPVYFAEPGTLAPDLRQLLQWAAWLLSVPVLLFSAAPIFHDAWAGLRQRQVRMDLPVAIGIAVTFVVSTGATFAPGSLFGHEVYFDSMTMFVSFLLLSRYLALLARNRVASTLEGALSRMPAAVCRIEPDGTFRRVPLRELRVGDQVRVLAGEAFPADGRLLEGQTDADEALLTGESRPVPKQPGELAVAGSLNLTAPVSQRVERLGADTRFEAVVALVRSALTQRPSSVRAADRMAAPFLWGVLLLAAGAAAVWSVIDPGRAVWVAVSVLIVTCPCALSLAAPAALLAAAAALTRRGVLVQRIDAIESLATIDTLYFDKTGTVTEDRLQLARVDVFPAAGHAGLEEAAVTALAAALARHSSHPLSRALALASLPDGVAGDTAWTDITEHPGCGVQAIAPDGMRYRLGARTWVDATLPAEVDDATASGEGVAPDAQVWFGHGQGVLASFEFTEVLRPDAPAAVAALRAAGLSIGLLSGDTPQRVQDVAARLGIADAVSGASPETKLATVAAAQGSGRRVGMVGDGLNDAPVIARADVSFAMAAGTAITQARADFILLSGRLGDVVRARETAQRTMRIVRQNLGWAVAYNAVCVPLALFGMFPPWAAGLGMAASSLGVVLNALRVDARPLGH